MLAGGSVRGPLVRREGILPRCSGPPMTGVVSYAGRLLAAKVSLQRPPHWAYRRAARPERNDSVRLATRRAIARTRRKHPAAIIRYKQTVGRGQRGAVVRTGSSRRARADRLRGERGM